MMILRGSVWPGCRTTSGGGEMPRYGVLGFAALLLALVIAGCGSSNSAQEVSVAEGPDATKQCQGPPQSGGSLIYARAAETVTLNPYKVLGNGDIFTDEMLYQ